MGVPGGVSAGTATGGQGTAGTTGDPGGAASAGVSPGIGGFFSALHGRIQSKSFDEDLGKAAQLSSLGIVSQSVAEVAEAMGIDGPSGTGDPSDAGGADIGPPGTAEGEGGEPSTPADTGTTTTTQDQTAAAAQAEAQAQAEAEAQAAAEEAARQKELEDEKKRRDAAEKEAETKARQRAKKDAEDAAGAVGLGLEGGFIGGRRVRTTPLGLTGVRANVFRPTLLGG